MHVDQGYTKNTVLVRQLVRFDSECRREQEPVERSNISKYRRLNKRPAGSQYPHSIDTAGD